MSRKALTDRQRGQTPTQGLVQEVALLVVKAALSLVPLAALALDVGGAGVRFANSQQSEEFLNQVAAEIDALRASRPGIIEELAESQVYQSAVAEALTKLRHPRDTAFLQKVARACVRLGDAELDSITATRCLRALELIEREHLLCLEVYRKHTQNGFSAEDRQTVTRYFGNPTAQVDTTTFLAIILKRDVSDEELAMSCVYDLAGIGVLTTPNLPAILPKPAAPTATLTKLGAIVSQLYGS